MNKCLVLFSGGLDSFLCACMTLEKGCDTYLMTCDNGMLTGIESARHTFDRLRGKYGDSRLHFVGTPSTYSIVHRFREQFYKQSIRTLAVKYPDVSVAQINCLCCQTAMWVAALAYASAYDIRMITCGYRKKDSSCAGSSEYWDIITDVASSYHVTVYRPCWDVVEPKLELADRGYIPNTLKPQCCLGVPCVDRDDAGLHEYCENEILPDIFEYIDKLREHFENMNIVDSEEFSYASYNRTES